MLELSIQFRADLGKGTDNGSMGAFEKECERQERSAASRHTLLSYTVWCIYPSKIGPVRVFNAQDILSPMLYTRSASSSHDTVVPPTREGPFGVPKPARLFHACPAVAGESKLMHPDKVIGREVQSRSILVTATMACPCAII